MSTDDSGNKLINYRAVIPILTGAIQELSVQISELESVIETLQIEIDNLKNR